MSEPKCLGPCLSHCYKCSSVTVVMANFSFVYLMASVIYLIVTCHVGTPFRDSLTREQKIIKRESAYVRAKIFWVGIVISLVTVLILKPFRPTRDSH